MSRFVAPTNALSGSCSYATAARDFLAQYKIITPDDLRTATDVADEDFIAVLDWGLELACQCSNFANIDIGRFCIQHLPKVRVLEHIEKSSEDLLATNDEWEYRRLLELYSTLDAALLDRLVSIAEAHHDPEIQAAGKEFKNL